MGAVGGRRSARDGVGGFATTMGGSSGERRRRRRGGSDLFEARFGVPEVVLVLQGHVAVTAALCRGGGRRTI